MYHSYQYLDCIFYNWSAVHVYDVKKIKLRICMQIHLPYMCSSSNQVKLSTCVKMGCYYFSRNYLFIFNPDISSYSTTLECVLLAIQIMPNPLEIDSKQRTVLAKRACIF